MSFILKSIYIYFFWGGAFRGYLPPSLAALLNKAGKLLKNVYPAKSTLVNKVAEVFLKHQKIYTH